jgi:hypothetical protein
MRAGRWKYLAIDGHEYLFELARDSRERANLARRHPDRLAAARARYEEWAASMPPAPGDAIVSLGYGESDLPRPTE